MNTLSAKYSEKARSALETLYTSKCTVARYEETKEGSLTKHVERVLYENIPCKLSFELSYPLTQTDKTAVSSQRVKLFTAPEIIISPGSRVTVITESGEELSFGYSGECACYPSHREIRLCPLEKDK